MKVAIFSDIHGNNAALDAVLEDIARETVDQFVCAGDIVNPFLSSLETWRKLQKMSIPVIRGNHEDYIASYFDPSDRADLRDSIHFLPVQLVAQHLGPQVAQELRALPFDHVVKGPGGDDLYICHASPEHNARSYVRGVDEEMAKAFEKKVQARTVVAGHIHSQWKGQWQGKSLVIAGSVGLPHNGKALAEYVIMVHEKGEWSADLRQVPYDQQSAMKEYRESGCLERGGPIAWLLYDEIWSSRSRLAGFLGPLLGLPDRPKTMDEWKAHTQRYLEKIGRWDAIKAVVFR